MPQSICPARSFPPRGFLQTPPTSGVRVLAADHDPSLRRLLEGCVGRWGYAITIAADGAEAWHLLRTGPLPDILILDWDMPRLDGLQVVRLVRAHERGDRVGVLVYTGREGDDDGRTALEAGADDFFRKPFSSRELQLRLAKVAKLKDAQFERPAARSLLPSGDGIAAGSVLADRYRLERPLAAGGMASVWIARHLALDIEVAVKLMNEELTEVPDYASFEREARVAVQLRSEHIVQVYDHGIANGGIPYMVMEYLPGESLADRVERDGPLPPAVVASIVTDVARALSHAHEREVVHRDVKPENILLLPGHSEPTRAKLIDFGLAVMRQTARSRGRIAGTPCYMAPEVIGGVARFATAGDVWALAVTAFTALTGTLAFDGASIPELLDQLWFDELPRPSDRNPRLTREIDAWFARACHHDPRERYATALELAHALRAASPALEAVSTG